ncbi:MAG TPA: CPBP family intramembrane glutamic endopeptidase [Sphingomicrobium sp.]|nr:CPBP family intramembrane glutamic endopeptidase [Sphingomicrobium sp.]
MAIAVAIYLLAGTLAMIVGRFVEIGQPADTVADAAIAIILLLATYKIAIAGLGQRPRDELRARGLLPELGKGIAAGALLFSAVVGIAALLGVYHVTGRGSTHELLIPLVSSAILPAFAEELLFRGIVFRWIEELAGSWGALVISSALFGLGHLLNPGATLFSSFAIAVEAGLLLGGTYMLTRSLWMPIGLHAAWNFTQGVIFGVPVSGGATSGLLRSALSGPELLSGGRFGLEGSVIALVICTAAGGWFVRLAVRRGQLVQPSWARSGYRKL